MIAATHGKVFWQKLKDKSILRKQGCYVFALRAGKGATPWYVGKSGKSFQQECFAAHKLVKYSQALFAGKQGAPVLFFVALPGKKNKIAVRVIYEIETYLIQTAKVANPKLLNKSQSKPPKWGIAHVVRGGKGKRNKTDVAFCNMLSL
ncbi:MAG: hypothetical protein AB1772_08020 [Candidatus Zixiibacteriota bacterium]